MRTSLIMLLTAATLAASPVVAADFRIKSGDTLESLLVAQKDKRITVRLRSGQEITGAVREVTPRLVQLAAITGRDFFDAVIALEAIEALVLRTRE